MKRKISLPIELTPAQVEIDNSPARFKVIMAGRRFGKTEYEIYWTCKQAATPNTMNWIVADTYRQAKEIVWRRLMQLLPASIIRSVSKYEMLVELVNGSAIQLKGSEEDPDKLRGVKINSVAMEEAAFQKEVVWKEILRAALSDFRGPALFISTPKGDNWFHKLYQLGQDKSQKEWASFHYTIYDNPYISRDEIEQIKREVSQVVWKQEYMAEVVSECGLMYPEFNERMHVYIDEQINDVKTWPMVRSCDWGINDDTAMTWLHVHPNNGHIYVTDEYSGIPKSVPQIAETFKLITGSRKSTPGQDVLAHDAFKTEGSSMTSIARLFTKEGMNFMSADRNLDLSTDILRRTMNKNILRISHKCRTLLNAIATYEHGKHEPDILSALRYGVHLIYKRKLSKAFFGQETVESVRTFNDDDLPVTRKTRTRFDDVAWDYEAGSLS